MKNVGLVYGSGTQARPVVVDPTTVYVHTNIQEVDENVYSYNEVQYTKDEYISLLTEQLSDTQLALCELFELVSGGDE
jgi:hypothetical protein